MSGLDSLTETCGCGAAVIHVRKGGRGHVLSQRNGDWVEHWREPGCRDLASLRARAVHDGEEVPLSYSALSSYENCPACYRIGQEAELAGHRLPVHAGTEDGRLFHSYIAGVMEAVRAGDASAFDAVPDMSSFATSARLWEFMAWREVTRRVVHRGLLELQDLDAELRIEEDCLASFTTPHGARVQWKARQDAVLIGGKHADIVDWKTGRLVPRRGRSNEDERGNISPARRSPLFPRHHVEDEVAHSLQAAGNAWALFANEPELEVIDFHFVCTQYPRWPVRWTRFVRSDLELFLAQLGARCDRLIEDTRFLPNPAGFHQSAAAHAPEVLAAHMSATGLVVPEITSVETAQVAFDISEALKGMAEETRRKVLAFAKASEEPIGGYRGTVLRYQVQTSWRVHDAEVVRKALEARGVDPKGAFVSPSLSRAFTDSSHNTKMLDQVAAAHPEALSSYESPKVVEEKDQALAERLRSLRTASPPAWARWRAVETPQDPEPFAPIDTVSDPPSEPPTNPISAAS